MKYFMILALLLTSMLNAITLDEVISKALQNNPSLDVITQRINSNKQNIKLSTNFANPMISLNVNDINFDEPQDRSLEPMQTQSITIEQKIPYFGKRDAKKSIAQKNETILYNTLESARSELIFSIKKTAYNIWRVSKFKDILDEYISITKQELELHASYTKESLNHHIDMASSELSLYNLELEMSTLESKMRALYASLSYLSAEKIENLELSLEMQNPPTLESFLSSLNSNPTLKVKESIVDLQFADMALKKLEFMPDISFKAGYYNREKFDDYLSVGVAFSLPIYSSEKYNYESSRYKMLEKESEKSDFENRIKSDLLENYALLLSAYNRYTILSEKNLAHIDHMFDILNSSVSIGADLLKINKLSKTKLDVKKMIVNEVADFHILKTKLDNLAGGSR